MPRILPRILSPVLFLLLMNCSAMERARARDATLDALGCSTPAVLKAVGEAVAHLVGAATAGRGAGSAEEWRALGLTIAREHGPEVARCAAAVAARELARHDAPAPTSAEAPPPRPIGFVATRSEASAPGVLGLEASAAIGARAGEGSPGLVAVAQQHGERRALAAAVWLRDHPKEW
jgi:hypothetical protein